MGKDHSQHSMKDMPETLLQTNCHVKKNKKNNRGKKLHRRCPQGEEKTQLPSD